MDIPYDFVVKHVKPQPTLFIRGTMTATELASTLSEYLTQIWLYLQSKGIKAAGPSYTRYFSDHSSHIEVEAGIPLVSPAKSDGHILAGQLPGGEVLTTVHIGSYETLPGAEVALREWLKQNGREAAGPPWELYWVDSHMISDSSQYRTEILMPLAPKSR